MNANNTFTGTNTFNSKLDTRAGIVGPVASLTYATDMIGYSFKSNGTGALQTITSSATPYFINVRTQFGGPVITLNRTASTYQCTRIA